MYKKLLVLFLVLSVLAIGSLMADWTVDDGHKMHFPQLPNVVGWDVNATHPIVLADDWMCSETGWVKDIHFWGSWMHGFEGEIISFNLSIHEDIPADPPLVPYSRPGVTLWEREITDFVIALPIDPPGPEGWYDPSTGMWLPEDHLAYYQYNVFLPELDWFYQEEGTIYWLNISATVADPTSTQWGWKSSLDHWNDDAVWAFWGELNWIDIWEPPDFTESLDLSFVITAGDTECEPTADGLGCKDPICPNAGDECQLICIKVDPVSGQTLVDSCACINSSTCHAELSTGVWSSCVVSDNGTGTADLPPVGCQYQSPDEKWMITGGLPPGTTIEMDGIIKDFSNIVTGSGGSLGGEYEQFDATLDLTVTGTGTLAGFNRHLAVAISCETHSAPRAAGMPVQIFAIDFDSLFGELFGDPDFCEFKVTAGTAYGMPSPGQTILRQLPSGNFAVESFFDIIYEIEFAGCPGSQLDDYAGTTRDTIRIRTGILPPDCVSDCPPGELCEPVATVNPDGTIDYCCECVIQICEPTPDGSACKIGTCPNPNDECIPVCAQYDPVSGQSIIIDCECKDSTNCHTVIPDGALSACTIPDNGTGTANLPPVGCQYQSPDEKWMITGGLPPGTTIEMDGIIKDFYNIVTGSGGSLGGEYEQFDATLDLTVSGTGSLAGFNRHLAVPISCETHSAPRAAGMPVQIFAIDFDSLFGELFGDPDFCEFKVTAGTAYGMPSPGQTTLRQLPSGNFAVESFFDIIYEIEFAGCPSSQLDDYAGTTRDTIRIRTGASPACEGNCPPAEVCEPVVTVNPDGTLDICCECLPEICEPTQDSLSCRSINCPSPSDECQPVCIQHDPATGNTKVLDCECMTPTDCHAAPAQGISSSCVVPDNGTGTADLPPVGCQYQSPDEKWMITGGLPPGTTIEMDGIIKDFSSIVTGSGGSLGGEYEQFDATLDLTVSGTGSLAGFNRHLSVAISCETHSAPRTPGDPMQIFAIDFDSLFGELFGDPDFCEFKVTAGTAYGMPSPGQTTLRQLPSGNFAVESFFDVIYEIEFVGCPGSQLDDYAGTTRDTIRIRTGFLPPVCEGDCPPGWVCEKTETINADVTIDVCCECVQECDCEPGNADGIGIIEISDAVYVVNYVFVPGSPAPTPYPICSGDADCNCIVEISDAVYLINYIFVPGSPPPCECEEWLENCGPPLR